MTLFEEAMRTESKERPILFSAPMVRAILDGSKTQTRRLLKLQPNPIDFEPEPRPEGWWVTGLECDRRVLCPCGVPGDRLWVRETFIHEPADYEWAASVSIPCREAQTIYRADVKGDSSGGGWKPSIFMPRELSRITLEITDVRVQRLQDISEEDAGAEGVYDTDFYENAERKVSAGAPFNVECLAFADLWNSINAKCASWESNPWVWAISFRRVTP